MNENECIVCQQPKDRHDPLVHDAVVAAVNSRIKRVLEVKE